MNALSPISTEPLVFTSAYRQLNSVERAYVDGYIQRIERDADRNNEPISHSLYRAIPDHVIRQSRGMLDKPMVRAAITERINNIAASNELSQQRVIREMGNLAFSNMGKYLQFGQDVFDPETGTTKRGQPYFDLTGCTPEDLSAIKSIKVKESGDGMSRPIKREMEITLHDKVVPLHKLAEYMGLTTPDNPHWRQMSAKPADAAQATGDAADDYAKLIGE